jgi:hypothetical protein
MTDNLYDDYTRHWTGIEHPLSGYIRIDGETFRFLGLPRNGIPVITQKEVQVFQTRTVYKFANENIELTLTFLTPCLPQDLDLFSWPLAFIYFSVKSIDSRSHEVSIYFSASADITVHSWEQKVSWSRYELLHSKVLCLGSFEQPILEKCGDFQRIDWGYLYLALPKNCEGETLLASSEKTLSSFMGKTALSIGDDLDIPRQVRLHKKSCEDTPVLACILNLGSVGINPKHAHLVLAYDDLYSVEYMQRRLRPYWHRSGRNIGNLLEEAILSFSEIVCKCEEFDRKTDAELMSAGGVDYALLGKLSFRQAVAAQKLVRDFDGTPFHFSKENTSNGCIATVDVIYPTAPFALVFNPELLRAELTPVLQYAESEYWPHSFAPHDLGTYPLANGQVYRGGVYTKEQMPVEECGNMLILVTALTILDGNADYARRFWHLFVKWADYLVSNGYSPDTQLCTDDFAGPLARNTNLSLKAIIALGAFSRVCEVGGEKDMASNYLQIAKRMADQWVKEAEDGDHYMLAFNSPGTWSLKYNFIWDKLFKLNLFPKAIIEKELRFYKRKISNFGCPLDCRSDYTKLDWEVWVASLYDSKEDFVEFIRPIIRFIRETPDRVPLSDWYYTTSARYERFKARSVVGGIFIRLLENRFKKILDHV